MPWFWGIKKNNKNIELVSFDIGRHHYTNLGKEFIDNKYPNRHTLILGNSLETIPKYKNTFFDLIFIDGGHSYDVAKKDILNCKRLSHKETIVIMDDTMIKNEWIRNHNKGVNRAWNEVKNMNDEEFKNHLFNLGIKTESEVK